MTTRLLIPSEVSQPCPIARIGQGATLADLEQAYMERGTQLVACDAARALALDLLMTERRLRVSSARQD